MDRVVVVMILSIGKYFSKPLMTESSPAPDGPEIMNIFDF